jgi:hypothetical protein
MVVLMNLPGFSDKKLRLRIIKPQMWPRMGMLKEFDRVQHKNGLS